VLGANRRIGFASMTLPKKPRELAAAGLPFKIDDRVPLIASTWAAHLEPDVPARLRRGAEGLPLVEESGTLGWFGVGRGRLLRQGNPATLRWVRDPVGLLLPVTDPAPAQPLDLARPIKFEARSFLGQRSVWETWMNLGTSARVGAAEGGVEHA